MRIYREATLWEFEPWSGAVATLNRIKELDKVDEVQEMLEDLYPEGLSETELNDFLWFDDDTIADWLDMPHGLWDEDCPDDDEDTDDDDGVLTIRL